LAVDFLGWITLVSMLLFDEPCQFLSFADCVAFLFMASSENLVMRYDDITQFPRKSNLYYRGPKFLVLDGVIFVLQEFLIGRKICPSKRIFCRYGVLFIAFFFLSVPVRIKTFL